MEWLARERPVGTVMFVDADVVFRAPVATLVQPGRPVAQHWLDLPPLDTIWERYTNTPMPANLQPVTWPALIHTEDLTRLLPVWYELTTEIRVASGIWDADMWSFIAASAAIGLRYEMAPLEAAMNWADELVGDPPILHYCLPIRDRQGNSLWYKQGYRPWEPIGHDPSEAKLTWGRELLEIIDRYACQRMAEGSRDAGR